MVYAILAVFIILCVCALIFKKRGDMPLPFSKDTKKISRTDVIIMAVVTILYSAVAFTNLGDMVAPTPTRPFSGKKETVAAFDTVARCGQISYYKTLGSGKMVVIASKDGKNWDRVLELDAAPFGRWTSVPCDFTARFVAVDCADKNMELCEIAFFDKNGKQLSVSSTSSIFDEQDKVPRAESFLNSTYFDEIYHVRTAHEHINLYKQYENTHPPLGKLIIALGIKTFGMNPFGWRFMGTLFGALMLPLIYLFAKRMFKNTFLASSAMLLLTFDFMHFAQTRIATIDTYGVFFIMLMYYFMYIYYDSTKEELPLKKAAIVLFLSGLSFGLGIASKWIVFYAGAGLAVLFFMALAKRGDSKSDIIKTLLLCIVFFAVIPFGIYFASYIPVFLSENSENMIKTLIDYQKHMFTYHSSVTDTHPFSSKWYQWPLVYKPIWYWGDKGTHVIEGTAASIVSLGNPLIWWGGTLCAVGMLISSFKNRNKIKAFILIGFLSQYLPWMFIGRIVFIYHFFASVPFIILASVYVFRKIGELLPHKYLFIGSYLAVSLILFVCFYPVLSGMTVSREYITGALTWFSSWILCY